MHRQVFVVNCVGRDHSGDMRGLRVLLKRILQKHEFLLWAGFKLFCIGSNNRPVRTEYAYRALRLYNIRVLILTKDPAPWGQLH